MMKNVCLYRTDVCLEVFQMRGNGCQLRALRGYFSASTGQGGGYLQMLQDGFAAKVPFVAGHESRLLVHLPFSYSYPTLAVYFRRLSSLPKAKMGCLLHHFGDSRETRR